MSSNPAPLLPRVAFISGHIDLTHDTFLKHYKAPLDTAIQAGGTFILSDAGGVDTLALEYLLTCGVHPSRITIYFHTPPPKTVNGTMQPVDALRTGEAAREKYRRQGLGVKVIKGSHTERDAVMTEDSHYDILWVRPDEETRVLYGSKYRAGRISGTEKNRLRRMPTEEEVPE